MNEQQKAEFTVIARKYSDALYEMEAFINEHALDYDATWDEANQFHSDTKWEPDE